MSCNLDPLWAKPHKEMLGEAPRPVRVSSPCVGLNAQKRAANELSFPMDTINVFDVDLRLKVALRNLDPGLEMHVGKAGDVLRFPVDHLEVPCDGLVAGPPCPPHSDIGQRRRGKDSRCSVFDQVGEWIKHLVKFGLLWFVLENVSGILKRGAQDAISWADRFIAELQASLPAGWNICIRRADCMDFGIPQHRPRVFVVGVSPAMRATDDQKIILDAPLKTIDRRPLKDFLDLETGDDFGQQTIRQQTNILMQLEAFHKKLETMEPTVPKPDLAVIECTRDPVKGFSDPTYDSVPCFRCSNNSLWILPSPGMQSTFGMQGRLLKKQEKARLCGIVYESVATLGDEAFHRAVGNAIPVPLLGAVLAPVLSAWAIAVRAGAKADSDA